mmetsp:Transcript_6346/g.9485  ORF Transcript_6346/g.9485 Transcript_6346/m.9485 type:complete len:437 (+) Transcript_6346:238-1548(+)
MLWLILLLRIVQDVKSFDDLRFEIEWPNEGVCVKSPVAVKLLLDISKSEPGKNLIRASGTAWQACYGSRRFPTTRKCIPLFDAINDGDNLELEEGSHIIDAWLNRRIGESQFQPFISVQKAVHIHVINNKSRAEECTLSKKKFIGGADPLWLRGLMTSSLRFAKLAQDLLTTTKSILLVPAGLRCWTRPVLRQLGLVGASLPFDNGYFTPRTVLELLHSDKNIFNFTTKSTTCLIKHGEFIGGSISFQQADCDALVHLYKTNNYSAILPNGSQLADPPDSDFFITRHLQTNMILAHYGYRFDSNYSQCNDSDILVHDQAKFRRRLNRLRDHCLDPNTDIWFIFIHSQQNIHTIQIDSLHLEIFSTSDLIDFGNYISQTCGPNARLLIFGWYSDLISRIDSSRLHQNTQLIDILLYEELSVLLATLRDANLVHFVIS